MAVKRLSKVAKEFNIGISTLVEFLQKKGMQIEAKPNAKVSDEMYSTILKKYSTDKGVKNTAEKLWSEKQKKEKKETFSIDSVEKEEAADFVENEIIIKDPSHQQKKELKVVGKIDLNKPVKKETKKIEPETKKESEIKETKKEEPIVPEKKEAISEVKKEKEIVPEKKEIIKDKVVTQKVAAVKNEPKKNQKIKEEEKKVAKKTELLETKEVVDNNKLDDQESNENSEKEFKVIGTIDLDNLNQKTRPQKKTRKEKEAIRKQKFAEKKITSNKKEDDNTTDSDEKKANLIVDKKTIEPKDEVVITEAEKNVDNDFLATKVTKLSGPTVVGKIDLPTEKKSTPVNPDNKRKRKRKRIIKKNTKAVSNAGDANKDQNKDRRSPNAANNQDSRFNKNKKRFAKRKAVPDKVEVKEEDINKQIKETYAKLIAGKQKSKTSAKHRRSKRDLVERKKQDEIALQEEAKSVIQVTEFVTANELANMMDVSVTEIISTCMSLGLFVSINQRLDAETISLVAEEFNHEVDFISVEIQESIEVEEDDEDDLESRSPIITVMGHVDHGKTALLDFIRSANVIAGEAGGITQHIGAYKVKLKNGEHITFLDTPGHEAFTAMRARGAKVTDIVIIVVAADDGVMPQTVEAINHASAAGAPIIFAINKIDKPAANPDRIKQELAEMNYLIEEWGGKYQSADISAKHGTNIDELLELVLLEAEVQDLKANPNKRAKGTVIESTLDKGRGFLTTLLVKTGTMRVGDVILAGRYTGKIKAMFNERNKAIDAVGPSEPALILGLDGAPQAGDEFNIMQNEKEARSIANKREQLKREQSLRTNKHITLDEIGRRIAIGNFQELNIIVKGDVDGSIEALSDSLQKLSTEEIQVNIIHKAVGQISESDITLATASNAIIIGFQVRPSVNARKLAENEGIDIRLYSIIYDAIEELKDAMEGMLSPEIKEKIMGSAEVREIFKITKVGTIAGCMVKEGKLIRSAKIRLIRDGIVIYSGVLGSLRRFKEDVKEVKHGYECGLDIEKYNDIKEGDIIEAYENIEVKRTL